LPIISQNSSTYSKATLKLKFPQPNRTKRPTKSIYSLPRKLLWFSISNTWLCSLCQLQVSYLAIGIHNSLPATTLDWVPLYGWVSCPFCKHF
jgi:hypothetical protein